MPVTGKLVVKLDLPGRRLKYLKVLSKLEAVISQLKILQGRNQDETFKIQKRSLAKMI